MSSFFKVRTVFLFVLLILSIFSYLPSVCGTDVWHKTSWGYRKQVILDSSQVPSTLTNFPVLINITDIDLRDNAQDDGDDICFTNNVGVQLNHEIEYFNGTTGQLVAWVNVTSLSSVSDTVIYMYYGNSDASNQENIEDVWDANYVMVQHMNDATSSTILDSTDNGNDGTKIGANEPNEVTGKIGNAQSFDGSNDYILVSKDLTGGNTGFTFSCFMYRTKYGCIVKTPGNAFLFHTGYVGGPPFCAFYLTAFDGTVSGYLNWDVCPTFNSWDYVTATWDSSTDKMKLYLNGNKQTTEKTFYGGATGTLKSANEVYFGNYFNSAYPYFSDMLDEIRFSKIARSEDWIKTEYNNQVNATDGSFFSLSTQQASYATGRGQIMYTTPGYEIISLIFGILIAIFIIKHKRKKK